MVGLIMMVLDLMLPLSLGLQSLAASNSLIPVLSLGGDSCRTKSILLHARIEPQGEGARYLP